jgi:hypothetical protein
MEDIIQQPKERYHQMISQIELTGLIVKKVNKEILQLEFIRKWEISLCLGARKIKRT